jgi:hypothetical protein
VLVAPDCVWLVGIDQETVAFSTPAALLNCVGGGGGVVVCKTAERSEQPTVLQAFAENS